MSNSAKNKDRRTSSDRRRRSTPIISRYTFIGGKRKAARRGADRKRYIFVDLFSRRLMIILLSILLLSHIDTYLTLTLIETGYIIEGNPLMAFFLEYGVSFFIFTKFFITAILLIILCLLKNLYITKIGLLFLLMMYFSLIIYEIYIMSLL